MSDPGHARPAEEKPIPHARELRQVPFFRDLDPETLADLGRACRYVHAAKGEDLFVEGDPSRGMFLLLAGSVKIYRTSAAGRELILAIETPGGIIAELPLLDGESYPAACAALEESRLLFLPRDAFQAALARHPDLALEVLKHLGKRLRHLVLLVEDLSLLEVPQRVSKYLLEEAEKRGPAFTLTRSNQEIASRLGTVRELVSRNLHRLQDLGAIRIAGRRVEILDASLLRAIVEEA